MNTSFEEKSPVYTNSESIEGSTSLTHKYIQDGKYRVLYRMIGLIQSDSASGLIVL